METQSVCAPFLSLCLFPVWPVEVTPGGGAPTGNPEADVKASRMEGQVPGTAWWHASGLPEA